MYPSVNADWGRCYDTSGADIAVEAAKEADRAVLSLRHGIHVMRRYGKDGSPGDTKNSPLLGLLPWQLLQWLLSSVAKPLPGFPDPPYGVLEVGASPFPLASRVASSRALICMLPGFTHPLYDMPYMGALPPFPGGPGRSINSSLAEQNPT